MIKSTMPPKLWSDTIDEHRRDVHDAILAATAALVTERGLRAVTMSEIAEVTGIGRATLYKYFSSVEAILMAWHQRHIRGHLDHLAEVRDRAGSARERLEAVLEAYAFIAHEHGGGEIAALLHRGAHVAHARQHLTHFIRDLILAGAQSGELRGDVAADELATYCVHALGAANVLPSKAAVRRLVGVIVDGLRAPAQRRRR